MYDKASDEVRPEQIKQKEHFRIMDGWMDGKCIRNSIPKLWKKK